MPVLLSPTSRHESACVLVGGVPFILRGPVSGSANAESKDNTHTHKEGQHHRHGYGHALERLGGKSGGHASPRPISANINICVKFHSHNDNKLHRPPAHAERQGSARRLGRKEGGQRVSALTRMQRAPVGSTSQSSLCAVVRARVGRQLTHANTGCRSTFPPPKAGRTSAYKQRVPCRQRQASLQRRVPLLEHGHSLVQ